jgi:exopolysaccharide biosynthesis protein
VSRKLFIAGLAAACLSVSAAAAQPPVTLMPGVTYEDGIQFTPHGPVAMHIVRAPRPGGLYVVRSLLSNDGVLGSETLTAMQKRTSALVTAVSVNGDYTKPTGEPTGMLMRDGMLDHPPLGARSSAGIDTAGVLHVDRVSFFGTWRGTGQRRPLNGVNQVPTGGQVVLFTSAWGGTTPRAADAVDAVIAPFPVAPVNTDLTAQVAKLSAGGGTVIPPGAAVLQARGTTIAQKLTTEAPEGTPVTTRLILKPEWTGVTQAVGGGPVLVKNGKAIFRANEAFDSTGLLPRTARSAIGQLADGRILLVTVDGNQPGYSVGLSNFELALALQRLGATWAMALAPAQASAMAFDGSLLSSPAPREQPVAEALSVLYYGVYVPQLANAVVSPNGDGVAESQTLAYKVVRKSQVRATLTGPDGTVRVVDEGARDPGTYRFPFTGTDATTGVALPEGAWRFAVAATDDTNVPSTADRAFSLDKTLANLRVAPQTMRVKKTGGTLTVSADLSRPATLTLQIETPLGVVVDTVTSRGGAGPAEIAWDGLAANGAARAGSYVARLIAKSAVGTSDLQAPFSIRRVAGK